MNGPPARSLPPLLDWLGGWILVPPIGDGDVPEGGCIFRTLLAPGDLTALGTRVPWSFHTGIQAKTNGCRAAFLAGGFRIDPGPAGGPSATCVVVRPGVLVGQVDARVSAALFSAECDVQHGDGLEWLDMAGQHVALVTQRRENTIRFCLAAGNWDHAACVTAARSHIERDPEEVFFDLAGRRRTAWAGFEESSSLYPLLVTAAEVLQSRIRAPRGVFTCRWSSSHVGHPEATAVNDTFALAKAWSVLDVQVAEDIVRSSMACQRRDGLVPALGSADGRELTPQAAWPLLAQATELVWTAGRNVAFVTQMLPKLHRYLVSALGHFDPDDTGECRWTKPREAFVEETFAPDLLSADLPAMLLSEIDSILSLGEKVSSALDTSGFLRKRAQLANTVESRLWDPEDCCFPDQFKGGERVERLTISAVMPLLWKRLPNRFIKPMARHFAGSASLLTEHGVPLWIHWEDDPATPRIPAAHQVLMIEGFERHGLRHEQKRLQQNLAAVLSSRLTAGHCLPEDLAGSPTPSPATNGNSPFSNAGAALTVIAAAPGGHPAPSRSSDAPDSPGWVIRHQKGILITVLALLVASFLSVLLVYHTRKTPPASSFEASTGLAQRYYDEGRYDEALAIYRKLLAANRFEGRVEFRMGNAYMHKGDLQAAEESYRAVLDLPTTRPKALMNLGIVLFRQGRLDESKACYEAFLAEFSGVSAALTGKAEQALVVIEKESALRKERGEGSATARGL